MYLICIKGIYDIITSEVKFKGYMMFKNKFLNVNAVKTGGRKTAQNFINKLQIAINDRFDLTLDIKIVWIKDKEDLGYVSGSDETIYLNYIMLKDCKAKFINNVIPHELSHIITNKLYEINNSSLPTEEHCELFFKICKIINANPASKMLLY